MNFSVPDADISTAQLAISPKGNPTNDEAMINIAAYHVQQGFEKLLKLILYTVYDEDESEKKYHTHNINSLIGMLEKEHSLLDIPNEVKKNAFRLTRWETECRYNSDTVADIKDIRSMIELYYTFREYVEKSVVIKLFKQKLDVVYICEFCKIDEKKYNNYITIYKSLES